MKTSSFLIQLLASKASVSKRFVLASCLLFALHSESELQAVNVTWDINSGLTNAQDGAGNWTVGGTTFWNGTMNVATTNNATADIAIFGNGGVGDIVNVSTQSINGLIFDSVITTGYTLTASAASQVLTIGNGGITMNAGALGTSLGSANLGVTLSASQTWTNNSASALTVAGALVPTGTLTFDGSGVINITASTPAANTTALIKNGAGTVNVTTDLNTTGAVAVNNGLLNLTFASGSADFTAATIANGATLRVGSAMSDSLVATINAGGTYDNRVTDTIARLLGSGTVTNGAASGTTTITVSSTTNATFDGLIQNGATATLGFTKANSNVVTLTGTNTYTGTTTINRGTLALNFNSTVGAGSMSNIISASSALAMNATSTNGSAILSLIGATGESNSQTFASTAIQAGANTISVTSGSSGGSFALDLKAITVTSGATLQLIAPASGSIATSNAAGPMARSVIITTAGVTSFAEVSGGFIVADSPDFIYQNGAQIGALPGYSSTGNMLLDNTSNTNTLQATGITAIGGLSYTDTAARTMDIGAGNTLQFASAGGIISDITAGNLTIGTAPGVGTITAGTSGASSLTFHQLNAAAALTVNSVIANNAGSGAVSLIKSGVGRVVLTTANTYSGSTTINEGTLEIRHGSALGTIAGTTTVFNGAELALSNDITTDAEPLIIAGGGVGAGTAGALRNISGNNTYTGVISVGGTSTIGSDSGSLTLDVAGTNAITSTSNSSITFAGSGTIIVNDVISMTGASSAGISKNGTGTLFLNASTTLGGTGIVTLNDGVIRISNGGALGSTGSGGTTITDNAALELVGGITTAENMTTNNSLGVNNAGAIRNISGNNIISGFVTIDGGTGRISSDADLLTVSGEFRGDPSAGENRTAIISGAGNTTLSGIVRNGINATPGILTLTKEGDGVLTLSNSANTYTGATLVSAGTLSLTGNINNASTVTVINGATLTQSTTGVLAGSVALINRGLTTLSGTNTTTGGTTTGDGTLTLDYTTNNTTKLANAGILTLGGGSILLSGGSHLEQVGSTTLTAGTTTNISRSTGTSVLALGAITPGASSLVNFNANNIASTTTANNAGGILGGWATVTLAGVTDWATNSGVSDGGTGSLITAFTAYNDITRLGPSTVPDDVTQNIRIINGGTAGNIALASTATEISTLKMDASDGPAIIDPTNNTDVFMIGGETGGGILQTATSGGLTIGTVAGDGILTSGGAPNSTPSLLNVINESTANSITINSVIANNGATNTDLLSLTKSGAGALVLNASNTYTGGTQLAAGILRATTSANALGTAGTVSVNGGELQLANNTALNFARAVSIGGSATFTSDRLASGAGVIHSLGTLDLTTNNTTLTFQKGANVTSGTAGITFGGAFNTNGNAVTLDVGADFVLNMAGSNGTGSDATSVITKTGAGTWIISSGNNLWEGPVIALNQGTLDLRNANALGDNSPATQLITAANGTTLRLGIDASSDFRTDLTLTGTGSSTTLIADRNAAGAANTHTMDSLNLGSNTLIVQKGSNVTSGIETVIFDAVSTVGAGATINADTANVTISGNISGTGGSLTKTGNATLTLSGANTYTGNTLVSVGTLAITNGTGSATGAGTVTVATNAILSGSNGSGELPALVGAVSGPVNIQSGGKISPGSGIGVLRLTDLTMEAGSLADLDITSPAVRDRLLVNGTLTLTDSTTFNVLPLSLTTVNIGDVFDLLDWTTLVSGGFDIGTNLRSSGSGGGDLFLPDISGFGTFDYVWDVSNFLTNGQISVAGSIVPEPSRAMLLFAGLALAFMRRRR